VDDKIDQSALSSYGIDFSSANVISISVDGKSYTLGVGSSKSLDTGDRFYVAIAENAKDGKYAVYSVNALSSFTLTL